MAGDGLFVKFNSDIMTAVKALVATSSNVYVQAIAVILSGAVTLYIIWMGYQTLAGKIQTPMQDVVWNLAKMGIILAFIDNSGGYLTATLDALQGFKDGLSGNEAGGVWATLDSLWLQTQTLAETILSKDSSTYVKVNGGLGAFMVWVGSAAVMTTAGVVFFTSDMTMTLLGLTAPLFIFCLMFGFLRTMFNNWLQLMFSSILTVMFASLVVNIGMAFMIGTLAQVEKQAVESNLLTMGFMACVSGVLVACMVLLSAKYATQLAGVGVDGAMQGMAMAGIGMGAGLAAKTLMGAASKSKDVVKGAAKGMTQGGDAKTNSVSEWAGKQAGRATSAGYKATKARVQQAIENMKARNNS